MYVIYPVTWTTLRETWVPVSRFQSNMSVKCVYGMKDSDSVTYEVQFDGQLSALVSPVCLITHSDRSDLSTLEFRETENPVALTIINVSFCSMFNGPCIRGRGCFSSIVKIPMINCRLLLRFTESLDVWNHASPPKSGL